MEVYATLQVDDVSPFVEIHEAGEDAIVKVGHVQYPVISVNAETNEVEVGHPVTYH